ASRSASHGNSAAHPKIPAASVCGDGSLRSSRRDCSFGTDYISMENEYCVDGRGYPVHGYRHRKRCHHFTPSCTSGWPTTGRLPKPRPPLTVSVWHYSPASDLISPLWIANHTIRIIRKIIIFTCDSGYGC